MLALARSDVFDAWQFFVDDAGADVSDVARAGHSTASLQQSSTREPSGRRRGEVSSSLRMSPAAEASVASIEGPGALTPVEPRAGPRHDEPDVALPVSSTPKVPGLGGPPLLSVTEISELPPAAAEEARPRLVIEELPLVEEAAEAGPQSIQSVSTVAGRQMVLTEILRNWDFAERDLTIEDLCPRPIDRLSIAVTFYNLLVLKKLGYVSLHHKPGSLELGRIEQGPELRRLISD